MGLQLKTSISTSDCLNLLFSETTGVYTTSNTTGWSTPNPALSTASVPQIKITIPSGSFFIFPLSTFGFPTANINSIYSIPYSSLGFSSNLEDGLYTCEYTVLVNTGSPVIYSSTISTFIVCNLECCVDRMLLNINDWDCDCSEEAIDKYLTAFSILQQINHSIECGDLTTASSLSNLANKICKNLNCSICH